MDSSAWIWDALGGQEDGGTPAVGEVRRYTIGVRSRTKFVGYVRRGTGRVGNPACRGTRSVGSMISEVLGPVAARVNDWQGGRES